MPAGRGTCPVAVGLEPLGKPEVGNEVPLVGGKRPLEGRALAGWVAERAADGREVDPELWRFRVGGCRRAIVPLGCGEIACALGPDTKGILDSRMAWRAPSRLGEEGVGAAVIAGRLGCPGGGEERLDRRVERCRGRQQPPPLKQDGAPRWRSTRSCAIAWLPRASASHCAWVRHALRVGMREPVGTSLRQMMRVPSSGSVGFGTGAARACAERREARMARRRIGFSVSGLRRPIAAGVPCARRGAGAREAMASALDPEWLAHRLDPVSGTLLFARVPRAQRAAVPFLTDDHLGTPETRVLALGEAPAATGRLAFVFHSAFCCSTLIVNALEAPGRATGLKEPVLLNDIVGWRARGAEAGAVRAALDRGLAALARPFEAGEAVVVKPSNLVNSLLPMIAALRPEAPILLLHAPLAVFLRSIASKGLWGRLWVRELAWKLRRDRLLDFGLDPEAFFRLTDLQAAAVGWLAQQKLFGEAVGRLGARVRTLDSETFLDRPAEALVALFRHFGLAGSRADARAVAEGPVFARDAKTGSPFGRAAREAVHGGPAAANADEIAKVEAWAEVMARTFGVASTPGAPLLAP